MICYAVNSMAIRIKYGDFSVSAFIIFPLNYGTIPQAGRQEEEASFSLNGASFLASPPSLSGPGISSSGAERGGRSQQMSSRHSHGLN